eukprot:m.356886 g.356886  ORF g.356886 m.356886 type:complete len:80 (+) comp55959_c1_seq3:206-445(+)
MVQRHSILAMTSGVNVTSKLHSPLAATGMLTLGVRGEGTLVLAAYGGLFRLVLRPDEKYIVSTKSECRTRWIPASVAGG